MVQIELPRELLALPEAGSEILVVELDSMLLSYLLANLAEQIVFLIRADKEGCGEGGKLILPGDYSSPIKPHTKTVATTLSFMSYHSTKVGDDIVAFGDDKG